MRAVLAPLLVSALAATTPSCISATAVEGNPIPTERIADIRVGETTKQQILDWFGAPQSFTDLDVLHRMIVDTGYVPDDVLDAPYADVLVFQLTEARLRGLVLIVYWEFDVEVSTDRLIVFFDEDDRVAAWGYREAVHEEE